MSSQEFLCLSCHPNCPFYKRCKSLIIFHSCRLLRVLFPISAIHILWNMNGRDVGKGKGQGWGCLKVLGLLLSSTPSEIQQNCKCLKTWRLRWPSSFSFPSAFFFILSPQIFSLTTSSIKNEIKKGRFCTFGLKNPYHLPAWKTAMQSHARQQIPATASPRATRLPRPGLSFALKSCSNPSDTIKRRHCHCCSITDCTREGCMAV